MPVLITDDFKGKELYFDMRPNGIGERAEGFWAVPLFDSDRKEIARRAEARGKSAQIWIEMLVFAVRRWEGFVDLEGRDVPCTEDSIRKLCESDYSTMMVILNMVLEAAKSGKLVAEKN